MTDDNDPRDARDGDAIADSGMEDPRRRKRRAPRRITQAHLENVALWYLGRFATSAEMLRTALMRRVAKSVAWHGTDPAEGEDLVRALIARYREAGLLNDRLYAEGRARGLHARGLPLRAIRMRLKQKGVGAEDIEAAIEALAEEIRLDAEAEARLTGGEDSTAAAETPPLDLIAAKRYAQKRRLGPWRRRAAQDGQRQRDLAALARAGFDYGTASAALETDATEPGADPGWPDPDVPETP